jgi:hypothetical protein
VTTALVRAKIKIDITHLAFAFTVSQSELDGLIKAMQHSALIPAAALQAAAQQSILLRGLLESAGIFTSGMLTCLNKLGPDNLGEGYAGPIDRQWAVSLTPVTFRWRMPDVALALADGLKPALTARPGAPLHLLNIAGGPAMDSLNALILLHKQAPGLLARRMISLHVLDLDPEGPDLLCISWFISCLIFSLFLPILPFALFAPLRFNSSLISSLSSLSCPLRSWRLGGSILLLSLPFSSPSCPLRSWRLGGSILLLSLPFSSPSCPLRSWRLCGSILLFVCISRYHYPR